MSLQYRNKSNSQLTSPTPAQLPVVALSAGHIVYTIMKCISLRSIDGVTGRASNSWSGYRGFESRPANFTFFELKEKCPRTGGALYVSKLTTNTNKLAWIAMWLLDVLFIYSGRQLAFSVSSWPGASFQNRTYWDRSALFWIPEVTVPSNWRQAVIVSRGTTH
jgi:hypothetical protein